MIPMSLPDASSEPVKVMPPMTMSRTVGTETSSGIVFCANGLQVGEADVVVDRDQCRRAAADRIEERHQLGHRGHLHGARGVQPEPAADGDAGEDDDPGGDARPAARRQEHRRPADGEGHAARRDQVAVPRRGRRVHPHEAEHEAARADQPGEANEGLEQVHDQASALASAPRRACA
jgi:hypothetical protein